LIISRIIEEPPLEESDVDERRIEVHEFKKEDLERIGILVFRVGARILQVG